MSELPFYYGRCDGFVRRGRVTAVGATTVTVSMPALSPGGIVSIQRHDGSAAFAQVRRVDQGTAVCAALNPTPGVIVGAPATATQAQLGAYVGASLLGQAVDAWGRIQSGGVAQVVGAQQDVQLEERRPITRTLLTGVAAIDGFCAIGAGQRVALFSGAGVGKTTLLRKIAQQISCHAQVVALIGERAREAVETIEALRAGDRWPFTTVVCATAAAPALERIAAVRTAQAQADWLCAQGCDVLLTVDSLTRVANAWRELAIAAGEPPSHRGHPASMVSMLASVVENAGARQSGSITGIYSVLVDGDDPNEPVSDAVRGLLDGHIMLARRLADAGHFPAIDVLRSSSRLMRALSPRQHLEDAVLLRRALATFEDSSDLLAVGAYKRGADAWLDAALDVRPDIESWLFRDSAAEEVAAHQLSRIARRLRSLHGQYSAGA